MAKAVFTTIEAQHRKQKFIQLQLDNRPLSFVVVDSNGHVVRETNLTHPHKERTHAN